MQIHQAPSRLSTVFIITIEGLSFPTGCRAAYCFLSHFLLRKLPSSRFSTSFMGEEKKKINS